MGGSSRDNVGCRTQLTSKNTHEHEHQRRNSAKSKFQLVGIISCQSVLCVSVRLALLGGLWSCPIRALGQERLTNDEAAGVGRVAIERPPHQLTSTLSARTPEIAAWSAVEPIICGRNIDKTSTNAVSAATIHSGQGAVTFLDAQPAVPFASQLDTHDPRNIQVLPHQDTRQSLHKRTAYADDALRRRSEGLLPTTILHQTNYESRPTSSTDTRNTKTRCHLTRGNIRTSTGSTSVGDSRVTPDCSPLPGVFTNGVSARNSSHDCNSSWSLSSDGDGSVTSQVPQHSPVTVLVAAPQHRQENNYHKQWQERSRQGLHPYVEMTADELCYHVVQPKSSLLNKAYNVPQRNAHRVRFLAAEDAYGSASGPVDVEGDAHIVLSSAAGNTDAPAVALAAGNTNVPEVEKEAMALLSGVRGRHNGRGHWGQSGTGVAMPGGFPYYYSTLTPQQMQMLVGQQPFQLHPGGVEPLDNQQQQLQSQAPQVHPNQQAQHRIQWSTIPPMYAGPQRVRRGMGGRLREGRRFSRGNRPRRQQQRLQRQQLLQLFREQQAQLLQQRNMGATTPYNMYAGNAVLYPVVPQPTPGVRGGTDGDVTAGEYTGVPPTNAGHRPSPYDPNLLPLQHRQQSAEGMRLEAQLRNQHDVWRARERNSV